MYTKNHIFNPILTKFSDNISDKIKILKFDQKVGQWLVHRETLCALNPLPHNNTFWRPWETNHLKTLEKGEIACNEQFLLYPVFSTHLKNFLLFSSNLKLSSADCFNCTADT